MNQLYTTSLFIFRRDLRIDDNTGLYAATQQSKQVIPCFIIDPVQVKKINPYRSLNAIQFMRQALHSLQSQFAQRNGHLYVFFGPSNNVIPSLIQDLSIDAVFVNRDYTPFSIHRDETIQKICLHNHIKFHQYNDVLLNEPEDIKTGNNTPYSIFTPFFNKARLHPVAPINLIKTSNWYSKPIKNSLKSFDHVFEDYQNNKLHVAGTHKAAQHILANINSFDDYAKTHDIPSLATTNLSPYIKFGLVSIRQVYHTIYTKLGYNPLIRQLYWRDFFVHIAYFSPFVFGQPFQQKYADLPWENNQEKFVTWQHGLTGFPIIDAGMRQLRDTGYMHNRVRLLTASFLVKDLHIDWRWGEQYFAQQLVDYDPAVNNGNWQWIASTGTDSQPYFRIFNPWIQQKKFDPACLYIKKWIPELANLSSAKIHNLNKKTDVNPKNYPVPILDHTIESAKTKLLYKTAK